MADLNKVLLMGNITRDPDVRYTTSGTAVCRLGLAVNRRFTTRGGDDREETCFVDIDVFGRQAETSGQYLRKGSPALVEGRLRLDQWDDKQTGQKRSRLMVVAERVQFLGQPRGEIGQGGDWDSSQESAPQYQAPSQAQYYQPPQPAYQPPPQQYSPPAAPSPQAPPPQQQQQQSNAPRPPDVDDGSLDVVDDIPF